jgi:uncharacterized RDD family membrane protein YckC
MWDGDRWVPTPAASAYRPSTPRAEVPSYFVSGSGSSATNPYAARPAAASSGYGQQTYGYTHHFSYASWAQRVGASLLDNLLLFPFSFVAGMAGALMTTTRTEQATDPFSGEIYSRTVAEPSGAGLVVTLVAYVAMLAFVVWNQWIRQGRTGYSLGKQWVGIRVVKEGSALEAPGVSLTIGRSFAHILDALPCYLGYLWPLWDGKSQTFADKICGTVVIDQRRG